MPNAVMCEAIDELKIIEFIYEDSGRVVEPYAYGRTRRGNDALRGYQIGSSSEGTISDWKLFAVEKMEGLRKTDRTFEGSAPGYAHGDSALSPIYCRVP